MKKIILKPSEQTLKQQLDNLTCEHLHLVFQEGIYITGCTDVDTLHLKAKTIVMEGIGDAVIYDNKGHMINSHPHPGQLSSKAHTILLEADEIRIDNLTFVNGCNIDFEYKGQKYKKVSDSITQAYAFGAWNVDYLEINNSKFLSILDTLATYNVKECRLKNCYVMGNNDFLPHGEKVYMTDCTVRNMGPCPMWSSGKLAVYDNVQFHIDPDVSHFSFTKRGGNLLFMNCVFQTELEQLQFEIEPDRESRYYLYNTLLNDKKLTPHCHEESLIELRAEDLQAVRNHEITALSHGIRGDRVLDGELILHYDKKPEQISVSEGLEYGLSDGEIRLTSNIEGNDKEGYIEFVSGFIKDRYYFNVVGRKVKYPRILQDISYDIRDSRLFINYKVEESAEVSDISYACIFQEDMLLYKINKHQSVAMLPSDIGKSFVIKPIYLTTESKELAGNAIATRKVEACDIRNAVETDFAGHTLTDTQHLYMDCIKHPYLGDECENYVSFDPDRSNPPFTYTKGTDNAKDSYGLLYTGRGAALIYPIRKKAETLRIELELGVEKSNGVGFGSANGQFLELFLDYDRETFSGIALRLEREASRADGVYLSIRKYANGVNRILNDKIFTRKYLTGCKLVAEYKDCQLTFSLMYDGQKDVLSVPADSMSTVFMLRCTGTTGVGNRFVVKNLYMDYSE